MLIDKTTPAATPGSTSAPESLTCAECCAQLPSPEATNFEMDDYVLHFCSARCYQTWHTKAARAIADQPTQTKAAHEDFG